MTLLRDLVRRSETLVAEDLVGVAVLFVLTLVGLNLGGV
jgi:hypothetical protein